MIVWEWLMISTSCWPVPTVSTMMISFPMTSMTWTASPTALERPPRAPRVARLRTKTPGSSAWRCIRIRSPRIAPPVKGEVGSTARTPTVFSFFRKEEIRASTRVLLPAPGAPVIPMTWARPVWGKMRFIEDSRFGEAVLEVADQPGGGPDIPGPDLAELFCLFRCFVHVAISAV